MSVALTPEHAELAKVAHDLLTDRGALGAARAAYDGGAAIPPFWKEIVELGWLGLHVPEAHGGSGFGLLELAVVAEQLGRHCTPGPFLPTTVAAGVLSAHASAPLREALLPDLLAANGCAGLALATSLTRDAAGLWSGRAEAVVFGADASVLMLAAGDDLLVIAPDTPGVTTTRRANLDPTQPCAQVTLDGVTVEESAVMVGARSTAVDQFRLVAAALASGGTLACRELAVQHATARIAFGRPIGQFQAIKHACVDMLTDEQLTSSLVWDAARPDNPRRRATTAAVGGFATAGFARAAKTNLQVHGGMGCAWEHDAHLFVRRAWALKALVEATGDLTQELVCDTYVPGKVRVAEELPREAEVFRTQVRAFLAEYQAAAEADRHALLIDNGYLYPHWPAPWGRDAGPIEQLVIKEELADVPRFAPFGPNAWELPIVLPTIMRCGSAPQQERWIRPTLEGRESWCQLFSEPGAGSDLASLATAATRVDGGWSVTGQKAWTSTAQHATLGLALVRTGPTAQRHRGISCMVIDMKSPGVLVRPLRQLTGSSDFSEVFLDEVFVPDENVVGDVHGGWKVAMATLEFERGAIGGAEFRPDQPYASSLMSQDTWPKARAQWQALQSASQQDPGGQVAARFAELVSVDLALRAMKRRIATRSLSGLASGSEGRLIRLVSGLQAQLIAELGMQVAGESGIYEDGNGAAFSYLLLESRKVTIAGGTTQILRNVAGESILGLPRDKPASDRTS